MIKKIRDLYIRYKEVIHYIVFGILTTVVNIVVFFLLENILSWPYLWANSVAIAVSILFAYVTNKLFVFESKSYTIWATLLEFFRFISFRLLSGIIDMLTMWLLVDGLSQDTHFSKIITQIIVVVLNYVFSKLYIFNK
ncbi:MAG: GtrA family protein [Atopococcus tabaci]|uniref:GtrA family protein n=1 Tax=Atopococcus tabaci TaxID=269774 RepID=A0AA43UBV6_9LACT|nr:GtrA family protein [Atopococcus tabaci]